jgi:[acyl-carrier-protein] S-malonyltransferase
MKLAYLFPGQGSQRVGMGAELAKNFTAARRVFEEADEALKFGLSRLCFEGPEEQLRLTANTQPAMVAVAIAAQRALEAEAPVSAELAAGHSLGEYSALVAAGALDFGDTLRTVRERGRLMQEACPAGEGAMAALLGLDPAVVAEICRELSVGSQVVVPANLNGPGQIVVAGHAMAVRRAVELARERGSAKAVELKVSAPFHSPLMGPARSGMETVLAALAVGPLRFGVIANVTAAVNTDPASVKSLLLEQITSPVRWEESIGVIARSGISEAIEFGCGRVLAGLVRRIDRDIKVRAVEDLATLKTAVAELAAG